MNDVFINKVEVFLPNTPVSNDEVENKLGRVNGQHSINKGLILRSNQIKTRYYAIDEDGHPTHSNAELACLAIKKLFTDGFTLDKVELITAGTSSPDNIQPSHALMVHGELGGKNNIEVMSTHGTCNAAMQSLKYAFMSVKTGQTNNAVCVGSETFATWMHARNFKYEIDRMNSIRHFVIFVK